jgi:hypothetical protein
MINNFFNDGVFGFICFGITFILVEIIYKVLNEKTTFFTKKISMIIMIIIASIMYLSMVMGIIDYTRATNGEEPIFTWRKIPTYEMFITYTDEGDMNEEKGISITKYSGFGYSIVICSENVICDSRAKILPFGLGIFGYQFTGRKLTEFD